MDYQNKLLVLLLYELNFSKNERRSKMGEIITTVLSWFGISLPDTESTTTSTSSTREGVPGQRYGGGTR